MKSTHLVIQCPNCKRWMFYCDDSECECGVMVFEEGDACASDETTGRVMKIDLSAIDVEKVATEPD